MYIIHSNQEIVVKVNSHLPYVTWLRIHSKLMSLHFHRDFVNMYTLYDPLHLEEVLDLIYKWSLINNIEVHYG